MDSAKLNDWMQIVGMFAIVASLIFVGMEMRQAQKIALSGAYQARADSSMALRLAPLESEAAQSALAKRQQGKNAEELTPEELVVERRLAQAHIVYLDNMHYQYINGFLSEEQWQSNRKELIRFLGRNADMRRRMVESGCPVLRVSFCEEVRAAAARIDAEE